MHILLVVTQLWYNCDDSRVFFLYLTVGASRLMEAQIDLPCLLCGVGFKIFYSDASNVYVLS